MKKSWKQWMAITCALAMIVSLLPVTILAEEGVATPTDLAPVVETVQETEPVEVPAEEPVEEPAEEPAEEEKVTYTARIAAAKRDGKIFLTAVVEPEYTGAIVWEKKTQGTEGEKWIKIDTTSLTLMILPGSELIGKEIRFRLEDGTTSLLSYVVPELEPVEEPAEAPEEGNDEPVVEINQEEPAEENETEPAAEVIEEAKAETESIPEIIAEETAEEPVEEEQEIEEYETPLGLDDVIETEPEVQVESGEEPEEEETIVELIEEETIAEPTEEETVVEVIEEIPAEVTEEIPTEEETEAADDDLEIVIIDETPVQNETPAAVKTEEAPEEPEAEAETEEIIDGLDIREDADGMSVIINTVPKDAEIDVIGVEGDWVLVETEGEQGYIYAEDLEPQAETVEQPEETVEEPEETEETEEAVEEAEEVIDTSNMKVTIFTSRRKVMRNGAPIILTSKLDGFEGIEQINYQWYCDKGNGFEPVEGANSDSYTYTANSETLSWSWLLEVSF